MNRTDIGPRRRARSVLSSSFLKPILGVYVVFWLLIGLIVAVDPYDVYDWGGAPRLLEDYDRSDVHYLYGAVSRADFDVLLLGGSTLAPIQASDLVEAFPDAETAFNFSPSGPRPLDRRVVLDLVIQNSPADHIIIGLDWIYVLPKDLARPSFPAYLYDKNPFNDLRTATLTTLALAARKLAGGPLAMQGWEYAARQAHDTRSFKRFQSPDTMAALLEGVRTMPADIDPERKYSCDTFPVVTEVLMPALETFVADQRTADILVPPVALVQYHTWASRADRAASLAKPFLEKQIAMRRCATEMASANPAIRVFAFDTDPSITAELSNYRNPMHIYDKATLLQIIADVAAGKNELTPDNFASYSDELFDLAISLPGQLHSD